MNPDVEIVDFPTTRVAAVEYHGAPEHEMLAIRKLVAWRRAHGIGPDQAMTLGIHYSESLADYRIDICVSFDGDVVPNPQGVVGKEIPGGRCARVRRIGPRDYMPEAGFLGRVWLPASRERRRDFPAFFHYVNVGPGIASAEMITDIYLPIE